MFTKIKRVIENATVVRIAQEIEKVFESGDVSRQEKLVQRINNYYKKTIENLDNYKGEKDTFKLVNTFASFFQATSLAASIFQEIEDLEGEKKVIDYFYAKAENIELSKLVMQQFLDFMDKTKYANMLDLAVVSSGDNSAQLEEVGTYLYRQIQKPNAKIIKKMALYQYVTNSPERAADYMRMYEEITQESMPGLDRTYDCATMIAFNNFVADLNAKKKLKP